MASSISVTLSLLSVIFLVSSTCTTSASTDEQSFLLCLAGRFPTATHLTSVVYTHNSSSYDSVLQFSAQNPYLSSPSALKPLYIITPRYERQVQASVICSKLHGLQIRVRSGGHDYEGLSYLSSEPFVILDLINYRAIDINVKDRTAWVQAGAILGELYYKLGETSGTLGFPAGVCTTLGLGGHFSGGGIGLSMRKYGLSIDNIIDASIVDVNGNVLDRKSMGEDLFWAIRGGGAGSYGVVLSWKIKLVEVPPTVTVFTVSRTVEEGATRLMTIWQNVAPQLPDELVIRVILQATRRGENSTVQASFNSLYQGSVQDLLSVMRRSFPELGLKSEDCQQMSWVESTMYFDGFPSGSPREALLNRTKSGRNSFKATSDFVTKPISEDGLRGIWGKLLEEERGLMIFEPLGGKINAVSETETPFPHRRGNLYNIQHYVNWEAGANAQRYLNWIRSLYSFVTPYVTQAPRAAYLNYKDLDLGRNNEGPNTSYATASVWGLKYFKGNFRRLALVKGRVDKDNFFRNEQSIPPLMA
ncbi:berberine bridge enzyme-like 26 [Aristolochia californica]|uniref:berberine bridge enzyme-like 26 n=1 Tax=Aristolochia californica TaxID=171875 RepID=UPI0035E2D2E7